MELLKKIANILYYIIAILLVITLVISSASRIYAEKTGTKPTVFGYTPTIVVSGSMLPKLQIYSMNIVKHCDTSDVELGDIVVYWNDEYKKNIIHRVIGVTDINGDVAFVTKGDANKFEDPWFVTDDNIVGKVVYTMNWTSKFLGAVVYPDGHGIDYYKLIGYSLLLAVLLWAISSVFYSIWYSIKRCIYAKKLNNTDEISNNTIFSEASCNDSDHSDINEVDGEENQ